MRRWLDRQLGRVNMYLLILVALAVMLFAAVLLAAAGGMPFSPQAMIASAAVTIGSSVAASWLGARVFRIRPHLPSSMISGLLLFFLFWPTLVPAELASLAVGGAIAGVSKFALAWRGRHLFNPAAVAALALTVSGANASVWWVATGWLLPLSLAGSFLILWRTRKLAMGAAFALIATGIVVARLLAFGMGPADSLATAITSYPIVFLAGFMLSEPLTMPPRRWQQLSVAGLVAVLFAVPFQFGPLYSTPELALLIGNLIGFLLSIRRGLPLEFVGRRQLTPTSWEFTFRPLAPVRFRPGQYLEITLPHRADLRGTRRIFSIVSAPEKDLVVAVKVGDPPSTFKLAMLDLVPGERLRATGIAGDFVLPRQTSEKVLLIAGGIGITPFVSQLAAARDRDVVLIYSVRSAKEIAYASDLADVDARILVIAPEPPALFPDGWVYLGADRISPALLRVAVPDLDRRRAYVSGSAGFVAAVRRALHEAGARRVRTDLFSGY